MVEIYEITKRETKKKFWYVPTRHTTFLKGVSESLKISVEQFKKEYTYKKLKNDSKSN